MRKQKSRKSTWLKKHGLKSLSISLNSRICCFTLWPWVNYLTFLTLYILWKWGSIKLSISDSFHFLTPTLIHIPHPLKSGQPISQPQASPHHKLQTLTCFLKILHDFSLLLSFWRAVQFPGMPLLILPLQWVQLQAHLLTKLLQPSLPPTSPPPPWLGGS